MKPIHINFKPSVLFSVLIAVLSLAACSILVLLQFAWQIKLLFVIIIVLSALNAITYRDLLLFPWSIITLEVNSKNALQLTRKDGNQLIDVSVHADSVVTPYLIVVRYLPKDATFTMRLLPYYLIVLPDMVDAESYRQLSVWLRWGYARNLPKVQH